jgi:hypothetical protein
MRKLGETSQFAEDAARDRRKDAQTALGPPFTLVSGDSCVF